MAKKRVLFSAADFGGMAGRDVFGVILSKLGEENKRIVVLGADALKSMRASTFMKKFPERAFDFGIAESNAVSAAAGFAWMGYTPFIGAYGFLISMRCAEQVRTDICYPNLNVKIFTTATGLSMGTGGTTHHCTEDISIMRSFANLVIVSPSSPLETVVATRAIVNYEGPVFLRLVRGIEFGDTEEIYETEEDISFEIGKAITLKEGNDITLIATGQPVGLALKSAQALEKEGIRTRVINMHTVKPIDEEAIIRAAEETKGIVTIEENNILGGLGEAICGVVCEHRPASVKRIGIRDEFCKIGPTEELWEYHGLSQSKIIEAGKSFLK